MSPAQSLQDWMLALIVLVFIAIDVIILLVYLIYNGAQGSLEAIRLRNRENPQAEIGVSEIIISAVHSIQHYYF